MKTLNETQRRAVVSDTRRVLVLAGAGSGKTKTLIEKILYLTEVKGVNPSSILAITFTKNAANEMLDRMIGHFDQSGRYESFMKGKAKKEDKEDFRKKYLHDDKRLSSINIRTFHSLCYKLLREEGVEVFDNKFKIIPSANEKEGNADYGSYGSNRTSKEIFGDILIRLCEIKEFLIKLKRYILDYFVDKIDTKIGVPLHADRKEKMYTSLNGTKVWSKSEQYIADWFFRHNIGFEYEPILKVDFAMKPDFFIPTANLYLEHISDKSFPMTKKEEQYDKGGYSLVKTFEGMMNDSNHINLVLSQILKNRISPELLAGQQLIYKEEFQYYGKEIKHFLMDVEAALDIVKGEGIDLGKVALDASKDQHERVRGFYELAIPIIEEYTKECMNLSLVDFNDLNIHVLNLIRKNPKLKKRLMETYRYILVDEFQDVNKLQVELITEILDSSAQLFCVGDDWQSIYGFRGSDVGYIINFEKHFENAEVIKLDYNYRSTEHIVGASNEVIKHNKFKVEKDVKSSRSSEHKITVYSGISESFNVRYCLEKVKELLNQGYSNDDILFLYRRSAMSKPYFEAFRDEKVKFNGKTIHGAKGLEAAVVFIIGLTDGSGGFPDVWIADRVFQVIKKSDYDLLLEEERRLFYVAITRAKDQLYLITEKGAESRFMKEIPISYTNQNVTKTKKLDSETSCLICGNNLKLGDNFCSKCGAKVQTSN